MSDFERDLAETLKAQAAHPEDPGPYARAGALLAVLGRPHEALAHLDRALALSPAMPESLNNRGAVLRGLGRTAEAVSSFERALTSMPEYADARYNLAGGLVMLERYDEALPHYKQLVRLRPESAEIHGALARLLWKADRPEEGLAAFERAIVLDAGYADARGYYAIALSELGRIEEAAAHLEEAIRLAPDRPEFYQVLADMKPSRMTPAHAAALEAMLRGDVVSDERLTHANFALGKIYAAEPERSFGHFLRANAARRRSITYDENDTLRSFRRIAETFTPSFFQARQGCSASSARPVFIMGMPRSGTTLIEQILASHPHVFAAGELSALEDAVNAVLASDGELRPDAMLAAECDRLRAVAQRYLDAVAQVAPPDAERVTDKMPANVRLAGLIHTILPNAKMIHARRNPVDNCVSIFSLNFAGDMPWAYDLGDLGRYYRAYEGLAAHWRAVLPPESMIDVHYEEVVADLETQARRIVAYCGLDWDPACLEFYKTERPVKTASATQVRKPIYGTSVNRASVYSDLLKPLLAELEK